MRSDPRGLSHASRLEDRGPRCIAALVSCFASRCRTARAGRRDPRGSRAGHPRRGPLPQGPAARDGSWPDVEGEAKYRDDEPGHPRPADRRREGRFARRSARSLDYLRKLRPERLCRAPTPSRLQTMVFAAAEPERDQLRIAANVDVAGAAQIKPGDPVNWPGSWTYSDSKRGARR